MANDFTGGAAFPELGVRGLAEEPVLLGTTYSGMSLRDWFAGQALVGRIAFTGGDSAAFTARRSYEFADAMIEARAEQVQEE